MLSLYLYKEIKNITTKIASKTVGGKRLAGATLTSSWIRGCLWCILGGASIAPEFGATENVSNGLGLLMMFRCG